MTSVSARPTIERTSSAPASPAHRPARPFARLRSYLIALIAVAATTLVKFSLSDLLGEHTPFTLFGLTIIVAGALGGARSALAAGVMSTFAGWYFFVPEYTTWEGDREAIARALVLLSESLLISVVMAGIEASRSSADQAIARVERLQSLTSALASAVTPLDVARTSVQKCIEALGATTGSFVLPRMRGDLEIVAHQGLAPEIISPLKSFPTDAQNPAADAFRQAEPQWIEGRAQYARLYPEMSARFDTGHAAVAALPLSVGGRKLGVIALGFDVPRRFSRADRQLLVTIASQAAQSLERAQMFAEEVRSRQSERAAREVAERLAASKKRDEVRAAFLAEASAVLSEALDYHATLTRVAQLAVPRFGDWCAVDIVRDDGSHQRLSLVHADPTRAAHVLANGGSVPSGRVPFVLRSGRSELIPELTVEWLRGAAGMSDAEIEDVRRWQLRSAMVVPLYARGRVLGALTFVWAESGGRYSPDDLTFAENLAQRCAMAIDNAQLYAAEQQARQVADLANRAKDEFLAIMGHELRNPLAPMVNAVHLMKMREGGGRDRELAVLERQLRHMMRLLEDLLDVSRVLRDSVELKREVVELGSIVASAVEVAAPLVGDRGHELLIEVPQQGLVVEVDTVRMSQVLGNLLTNAAKYTPSGGKIHVVARADAARITLTVADNGVGIEPELMPRLFELFSQGKQSIDRQLGGLGIGLAIASRLVRQHGGELRAESDGPGLGSRFTVELPRAAAEVPAEPVTTPRLSLAPKPKRVLIVDDNEDSGELLALLVQKLGHETRVAFEGTQALELAAAFHPQAVLLDIGLPGMNGFEVARRMRELPSCATIPIVAVTGYARESDRQEAKAAGFSEHFSKPIALEHLRGVLDTAG